MDSYINCKNLLERLQISRSKFYAEIRAGRLPAPVKIGSASRWRESEVEAALERLADGRAAR